MSVSKSEKSFIIAGLVGNPPRRLDGRTLHEFRSIELETGVAPLANGSAKLKIGRNTSGSRGGTEIIAASKLEVETIGTGHDGVDGGRIVCSVTCSPAAYPNISSGAVDDLQHDFTAVLQQTLSHPSLHPKNLGILPRKKAWLLALDLVVLSDAGNIYDALFMAARAALWDTKVPRTRSIEYKAAKSSSKQPAVGGSGDMDVDEDTTSGFDTRAQQIGAVDFELPDYWDEGEVLDGRDRWPVAVTCSVVPPVHFLDADITEESGTDLRVLLVYSVPPPSGLVTVQAIRTLGEGELPIQQYKDLIVQGEKYAKEITAAIKAKLKEEDLRRNQKARDKFSNR